jgi:Zn-dependent protease
MVKIAEGVGWYLVFLVSIVCHEASHAFTAWKLGDPTAYKKGQVTLNPYPHIRQQPFGMVVVPILTFILSGWMAGWGATQYDPEWARQYPGRAMLMSFAGPAANLCLAIIAFAVMRIGIAQGFFAPPDLLYFQHLVEPIGGGRMDAAAFAVSVVFSLNLMLFIFNLLPLPPLDGSGIYRLFTGELGEKINYAIRSPAISYIGIIIAWQLINLIYPAVQNIAIKLLYPALSYG